MILCNTAVEDLADWPILQTKLYLMIEMHSSLHTNIVLGFNLVSNLCNLETASYHNIFKPYQLSIPKVIGLQSASEVVPHIAGCYNSLATLPSNFRVGSVCTSWATMN